MNPSLGRWLLNMWFNDWKIPETKWIESVLDFIKNSRENIPNTLLETIEELSNILDNLWIDENISKNERVLKLMDYILEKIYFDPEKREKEFQELKKRDNLTHEEITEFLERENDMDISGEDWQKFIHASWLLNWSMGEMWNDIKDRIDILSKISYFSMNTTLRTWIHTGLWLQNVAKYFPEIKDKVFGEFKDNLNYSIMLALTWLWSWSDLFKNIWVEYEENQEDWTFHLKWITHFQWLTDEATHWIVLAKNKDNEKEFKLFFVDTTKENQSIEMLQEYNMEMLNSITYWKNEIDAIVSSENISTMKARGLPEMLKESRLQFPAMTVGAMKRIENETRYKIELRDIADWKMIENGTINDRFEEIKIRHNIIDLINKYLSYKNINLSDKKNDIILANTAKAISTDYTIESARSAKILQWWLWFKKNNLISNIEKDVKPFAIFEWNNDMLYSQLVREYRKWIKNINSKVDINFPLKNIKDLDINDSLKGQIYANINIMSYIYEMWLENEYENEIDFLFKECEKIMKEDRNLDKLVFK